VAASLLYCVGAMGIIGALESGLTGNNRTLFAKSAIDGITAIIFSSTMGLGVLFSSVPVLLYQGTITLLAHFIKTSDVVIAEMTATGGLLIIGIASNMLGIKEFKVANMLPSVFIAALLTIICTWIAPFLIKL
jgi:uncharacterized membrane protein YqgA involved in biofilm formation